jgi:uncharacterized protein (DUF58 family)
MSLLVPFLIVLLIVALFTRVDAFFSLLYVLFGVAVIGRLWSRRALQNVEVRRVHDSRAFNGQPLEVRLEVANRGRLPVLWLRVQDKVPAALGAPGVSRGGQVVSLGPHERLTLSYRLRSERRGYYVIGPLSARSGDVLGSATYETDPAGEGSTGFVIVYPKIIPLHDLGFPSQSPFGTLPSRQRIFEDPTRLRGVRDYQPGDSLRQIDWKTSARVQALQVKRFEPAIALETAIFVNLNEADYPAPCVSSAPEMAIVVAASLAAHLTEKRQAVALATNGHDPLATSGHDAPATSGHDAPATSAQTRPATAPSGPAKPGPRPATLKRQDRKAAHHRVRVIAPRRRRDRGRAGPAPAAAGGSGAAPPAARLAALPLRKGRQHLMHVLDLLARIEPPREGPARPFLDLVCEQSLGLPWGSTAVLITAGPSEGLFDTLLTLRRRGLGVLLVMTCPHREQAAAVRRAAQIGVQAYTIEVEQDLDVWR